MAHRADSPCEAAHPDSCTCDVCIMPTYTGILAAANSNGSRSNFLLQVSVSPDDEHLPGLKSPNSSIRVREESSSSPTCADAALAGAQRHKRALLLDLLVRPPTTTLAASEDEGLYPTQAQLSQSLNRASGRASANISVDLHSSQAASSSPMMEGRSSLIASPKQRIDMPHSGVAAARPPQNSSLTTASVTNATGSTMHPPTVKEVTSSGRPPLTPVVVEVGLSMEASSTGVSEICFVDVPCAGAHREDGVTTLEAAASPSIVRPTSPYSPVFIHDLDCASLQQCSLGHRNGWEENSCRPNGNMASVEVLSDPLDGENEGEDIPRPCSTATPPPSERFISLFHHLRVFMVCAIAISSLGCILLCILVMWGDIIISRPSMSHSDKNLHTALDVVLSVLFVLIVNVGGGALLSYYLLWRKGIAPLLQTLQLAKNAAHQFCSMRGLPITQVEDEVQSVMNGTRAAPCGIAYHTSIRDLADSIQHANTEVLCLRTYLPATLMEVMETHESAARSIREEVSRGCRSANASISTTAEHSIPNDGLDNTTDVVDMPWPSSHSRRRRPFRRTVMAQLEMEDMAFSPSSWNHSRMEEMSLQSWACQSMSPSPTGARRRQLRRPNSVGEMAAARVTPNVAFSEQNSHPLNDSATFASEAAVPPSINLGSDDYSIKGGAKLGSERLMSGGGGRALSCESSTAFSLQNVSYGSPVASLRGRGMQRQFPSLSDYPVRAQRGQTWRDAAGGSGTTDVLPNEEVGPWVTVLVCKLFLRDGGVVHPHMDRQEVDEIAQSSSSFHRCISSVASCSGGVTCALTMDSGLITYNAFSPIPMVSAMNTAYEAALLLHAKLNHAIPRRSSTSRHHIHQWGIVVHQSRMAVGYGGNNRFVFPYVYGPELILARELVDLTARLQCPILTLQPNFNTAKHYQLAPLDIVGVDYTGQQASVLYELLSRDEAGDQHTAESALILKGLLALHKYDFGGAKMILHDLATAGNRHANHILRTATYFEAALLSGTEMLPLPEPYCMERPRWDVTVDCGWAKQFDNCAFLHETSSVRLFTTPSLLAPNHDGSQLASRLMSSPMDLHTSQSRMVGGEVPSQPDMHGSPLSRGPAYAPSPSLEANIVATKNPLLSQHLPAKDHPIRSPPPPRPDSCSSRALSNTSPSRGYAPGSFPTGSQSASQRDGPDLDSGVFPSVNPLLATANFISPEIIAAVIQSASCYSTVYEQALRPYLPRCGVQVLYQKLEEDHPVTPITDEAKAQPMMIYVSHDHHPDFTTPDVCTGLREDGRMVHIQRVPATEEFQHLADSAIREVEILSHQQHDNIVRYLCCAFQDHCIYIISEHVAGGSLASMINLFGSLPMEVVRRYVADILHALVHLHHHKITHGGISSNSIRVSNGGQCKLAGFGHARQMAILPVSASTATAAPRRGACLEEQFRRSSISMLEKRLRTPPLMEINLPYVSPEACEGEANELNDIWSLGVVVYECLTGHLPWSSTSLADPTFFMESLIREGLPTPPTVPDAQASDFIRRCLLRTRDGRPSSTELLFHPFIIAQ